MTFRQALAHTEHLQDSWQPGLQALRAEDKPHIEAENTRQLRGSADIDTALQRADPRRNRWDFAIAYQHTNHQDEFIYWVEIHTASNSEVNAVIKKARWLLAWLADGGRNLRAFQCEIVWVSSGATTFTLNAPQEKQMANAGLKHKGLKLRIPNEWPANAPERP